MHNATVMVLQEADPILKKEEELYIIQCTTPSQTKKRRAVDAIDLSDETTET